MSDPNQMPIPIPTDWGPWLGQLRVLSSVLLTLAASAGYLNADKVSALTNAIITVAIAAGYIGTTVWTAIANSRAAKTKAVAAQPDVRVIVGQAAPPDLKAVALDTAQPDVVPVPATASVVLPRVTL